MRLVRPSIRSPRRSESVASVASMYDTYSRSYDALFREEQMGKLEAALGAGWTPGDRLVDFGCGTALLTELLSRRCDIAVGLDVSLGMLRRAKRRRPVELVLADASFPPFRRGAFTSCSCFTSFHDFRRKSLAIGGMIYSVRSGGSIMFSLLARGRASQDELRVVRDGRLKPRGRLRAGNDVLLLMDLR